MLLRRSALGFVYSLKNYLDLEENFWCACGYILALHVCGISGTPSASDCTIGSCEEYRSDVHNLLYIPWCGFGIGNVFRFMLMLACRLCMGLRAVVWSVGERIGRERRYVCSSASTQQIAVTSGCGLFHVSQLNKLL